MLPHCPPLSPMLARAVDEIPEAMAYEPKWDGWRCLIFVDDDQVSLWSRRGTEMTEDFPELVAAARASLPSDCIVDGEVVIISAGRLDYTKLATRHAAGDKAAGLAVRHPATFLAFDLLAVGADDLMPQPQWLRRDLLLTLLEGTTGPIVPSPSTTDRALAQEWFDHFEQFGFDGVVAKQQHATYTPGARTVFKIKHRQTADVVIGGYRLDRNSTPERPSLGSVQLGLHDEHGTLHFVGVAAAFPGEQRRSLAETFDSLRLAPGSPEYRAHPWHPTRSGEARIPADVGKRGIDCVHLVEPMLVCEVTHEATTPAPIPGVPDLVRFRSNATVQRWRNDKSPYECTFAQVRREQAAPGAGLADWLSTTRDEGPVPVPISTVPIGDNQQPDERG
ncbi:ATP-dependent DNA ligase [Propionibacteriaceae bacterium Y1685]|uniref:ATP-dependent DNA ligase n=1 Tax=Microlunatus sp. Y1700 TaxID=3418487 RepID=UPI003B763F08